MASALRSWTLWSRLLSILFNLIAICTLAAAYAIGPLYRDYDQTFNAIAFIGPCCTIIWAIVSAVLLFKRKAYHPGWDVSLDLIAWLLLVILGAFILAIATVSEGQVYCLTYSLAPTYCATGGRDKEILDLVSSICLILNAINHFAYFVRGCRQVKAHRRSEQATKRLGMELEERHFSSSHP